VDNESKARRAANEQDAFHNIATGPAQQQQTAQHTPEKTAAQPLAPEKVIPLKGDENVGTDDFNELNG
jgi:hypothetical protein